MNYSFTAGNVLKELPFADQTFDFVHQRQVMLYLPLRQWPAVLRELRRVTKPGGYIEMVEMGSEFHSAGPMTQQLMDWWLTLLRLQGGEPLELSALHIYAEQAGIRSLVAHAVDLPTGDRHGRLGQLMQHNLESVFISIKPRLVELFGLTSDKLDAFLPRLTEEWNRLHTKIRVFILYGQP